MRQAARLSPEADHTVWWLLLCRAVERAARAAALREAVDIAAPERVAFSDDECRVRCEIANELRARAEGQGNG
jgi:hypothetical protein